jgi:photosystem II stability/assembly factor-like uncharacterized protein
LSKRFSFWLMVSACCIAPAVAAPFAKPIDTPARASTMAATSPLLGVAVAGETVVAVGQRGHILVSKDGGKTWQQAKVPVSTDLVAVHFPSATNGWAVGHGGVVLHSTDGGLTWVRQLEGKQAAKLAADYMGKHKDDPAFAQLVRQSEGQLADAEIGAAPPFLDVYFESETTGYIVGAFNRIFRTEDAGKTWFPWMAHVDNPDELHFYAIRRSGSDFYLTGEQGMVWRLDAKDNKFVRVPTGYKGTLFGLVGTARAVLAYGMNGTIFRSLDLGKSWERAANSSRAGINGGLVLSDNRILLVNSAGELLLSNDQGASFKTLRLPNAMPAYFGISAAKGSEFALSGSNGAQVIGMSAIDAKN